MPRDDSHHGSQQRPARSQISRSNVQQLLTLLDHQTENLALFHTALTHRPAANQPWPTEDHPAPDSNERLEYLGDAVLGTIVAEVLYRQFPEDSEGSLTRTRSAIVRTEQLAVWADDVGLSNVLYLAPGERNSMSGRERILAGAFEALVGALYLDGGLPLAEAFVQTYLDRDVDQLRLQADAANPKGKLQEITQNLFQQAPTYATIETVGPAHDRRFTVEVRFNDRVLAVGEGSSKRAAEEAAAFEALESLEAYGTEMLLSESDENPNVR